MVHFVSGCTWGVQVKLWDPLRTRAIPERLRGVITTRRYTNYGWKVEGDQGLGLNTGALALRAQPKAALGVGCGRGSPPPAVGVRGYYPRKIFENSDAKSCILATTCCEISCFMKTTAKKLGNQYTVGPPNLNVGGTSFPRSLQLSRLCAIQIHVCLTLPITSEKLNNKLAGCGCTYAVPFHCVLFLKDDQWNEMKVRFKVRSKTD